MFDEKPIFNKKLYILNIQANKAYKLIPIRNILKYKWISIQ